MRRRLLWLCAGVFALIAGVAAATGEQTMAVDVTVDVMSGRRPINPLIYGVAGATAAELADLNASWHRSGGNPASRYNWRENASNRASDWFFESVPDAGPAPGGLINTFIADARSAGAEPAVTIPMVDWVARLGPGRSRLASYSIAKYGPQSANDAQWFPDAGSGIGPGNREIRDNDPADANVFVTPAFQQAWVQTLASRVRYYMLDNEPSLWWVTHRDVHPQGMTMAETNRRITTYATVVKNADPDAHVIAPEEWGWLAAKYSGADQQWASTHGWRGRFPDRTSMGGMDALPWMLEQWRAHDAQTGRRLVDTVSLHYYPRGGEFSDSVTPAIQRLRNRSTRALWDPTYVDESWIGEPVALIPRMRAWVDTHYRRGTPIAITEYNWGAEGHMSGAVAQADLFGIFGREGLDMAARWATPPSTSPTFQVMKLFRNYDGRRSTFGDVSVAARVPDPDVLAAFAAERSLDGAVTIVLINKSLSLPASVRMRVSGDRLDARPVARYDVAGGEPLRRRDDVTADGDRLMLMVPAQSVTLLVVPGRRSR